MVSQNRPATNAEKRQYLANVSRGFTRSIYHNTPLEELPLYFNGTDFYMLTMEKGHEAVDSRERQA